MTARNCLECAAAYAPRKAGQRFCSAKCRGAFHRRRERRGAQLYDHVMMQRYDRPGDGPAAFRHLSRMASDFRQEDHAEGRARSWLNLCELRADGALTALMGTRGRV